MKTIRKSDDLREHIETLRKSGESDAQMAARLKIHVNTLSKLKNSTAMFRASDGMDALGLRVVFETKR